LPRIKKPPDKSSLQLLNVENGVLSKRKTDTLLPSNFDATVSAKNLGLEMLGKYIDHAKNFKKKRRVSWQDIAPSPQFDIKNDIDHITSKVNEDIIVKPYKVQLPPRPAGNQVLQPNSLSDCNLVCAISRLLSGASILYKPKVRFDISEEAAMHNYNLLKEADFDLERILNIPNYPSVTSYGSEFKSTNELESLFKFHPRWHSLKTILERGSAWKLSSLSNEEQIQDLDGSLERGNHKSASTFSSFIEEALCKKIKKGWELIIPLDKAQEIPNLVLSPMGVANQLGVNESGVFVPKKRLTHDLSFPGLKSGQSVNSRSDEESLEPCMFGHALLRIIHSIIRMRQKYPDKIIWIRKEDVKSAYRRMHVNADTALQAAVQLRIENQDYLLISLRLPFGGSPCPSEFCLLSDMITDTVNDLMACKKWDPNLLHSDYIKIIPAAIPLPNNIPFAQARALSVTCEEDVSCKSDVFVDDIITLGVDIDDNLSRIIAAPCTVMHAVAHRAIGNETFVPRQNFISEDKNEAEGAPEEVKITLGWELDSRRLLIKLPAHKYKAWSSQVESFLTRKTANVDDLRSVLGRLENIAIIIPTFGHFLNNIRQLEIKASLTKKNQIINKRAHEDFKLAQKFLEKARKGINMNLMTFREPNKIYINDASEHGLGGFATHGRAWAYIIPEKLRGRAHINLLEFLAQLVSIWIDVIEKKIEPLDCLLGMGDNTASMGWLRRSNFRENDEHDTEWIAKQKVARKLGELVLESDTTVYRQWFRGADNDVADSLSRDSYFLSNTAHELFLQKCAPTQVPHKFKIRPVPKEICSFITSTLLLLPVQQHRLKQQKPSELAHLNVGLLSSLASALKTSTSRDLQSTNKILSCLPSPKRCGKQPSLDQIKQNWWREQSTPPSHLWHRPSGQTTGLTQDWTLTENSVSSCKNNCAHIAMQMVPDENRKLCL
jgi:hypothetical protein